MKTTIGTCSLCGGAVEVDAVYWSVVPPTPTCSQCGAVQAHGPVVQMIPPQKTGTATRIAEIFCTGTSAGALKPAPIPEGWTDFVLRTSAPCGAFGPKIGDSQ